jgi:multidrug resistance efflux pump
MSRQVQTMWAVGAIIAAVLVGGCQAVAPAADEAGPLTASGTIRADEVRVASELGGRILEVRTEPGAQVKAGDALVVLDATPLLTQLSQAEAAVAAAQADLAVVEAGPQAEEIAAARAALAIAEAQRDGALVDWQNAQEMVEYPQDLDAQIADARTQVNLAAQSVELAEAELALERLLRDQRPEGSLERQVADLQVLAAEETLAAAQADEQTAQTMLNWLWLIRSEPLALIAQAHAAEGQYHVAEAGVAVAQARLDDLLAGPTAEEIAVAEAAVRQAQAQTGVLQVQEAKSTLRSPVDGVLLDQALRIGEVAAPAAAILTVADLSEVTLTVYVPENRIGQVRLGQTVRVMVDSFPGQTFSGMAFRGVNRHRWAPRSH